MDIHKNARLTVHGRERIVRQVMSGQTPQAVALAAGVCPRTIRKWLSRYRAEGLAGLQDRSSRPHRLRRPTSQQVVQKIEQLRRQRWTGKQIATEVGVSPATVSRVLRRLSLNKLSTLEPQPVRRYEREKPGELIHIDIKKLGRIGSVGHRITGRQTGVVNRHLGIGWEFVHVCIDDASRIAFSQVMSDERKTSAIAFLEAAVAYYASLGIKVERVMTDNGSCYLSQDFAKACKKLTLKHIRTKPYTPKTNGKAERFIQTSLREWAYARAYNTSDERTAELPRWLHRYNWHRPHASIGSKPPISRLGLTGNNLLRLHIPEFQLHDAVANDRVTVRDLLCHHSGLPRHDWIHMPDDLSAAQTLAAMRYLEPSDDIRTTHQYSNLGYLVASMVTERVSGQSWTEFTRARLTDQLRMNVTA